MSLFAFWADFWGGVAERVWVALLGFIATTVLSFLIGRWWGSYHARKQWERKHFLGRINVSLNMLANDSLKIRTVFERSLEEIFPNPVAVAKIMAASRQTTVQDPVLPIAKEDRWYLLNFVLNAIAEHFVDGMIRHDASGALKPVTYLLFLTCEVLGEDRIRKVRAMLIRRDLLEAFPYPSTLPRLERDWHADRIVTLRRAAALYKAEPDHFLPLEIYA